jgi:hypothetical protein
MAEELGRVDGYCGGRSGSLHIPVKDLGVVLTQRPARLSSKHKPRFRKPPNHASCSARAPAAPALSAPRQ